MLIAMVSEVVFHALPGVVSSEPTKSEYSLTFTSAI